MRKTEYEPTEERTAGKRVKDFVKRNFAYGLFILVLAAVCAATVWGIVGISTGDPDPMPSTVVENQTPKPVIKTTPAPVTTPAPTDRPVINEQPDDTEAGKKNTDFSIVLPFEKKKVITAYSEDKPIYSDTLDEWSCHTGLDFACEEGAGVAAAANGIVKSITNDGVYGTSVLICHTDDYYTLYCGVKDVSVTVDELVAQGQSIGAAAGNIPGEAHMACHIHFEVIKDGLCVDPNRFT